MSANELRNFRLIMEFDPRDLSPLLRQIYAHPELWNSDDAWTNPAKGTVLYAHENIVLRHKSALTLFNHNMNKHAFSVLSEAQPLIKRLMKRVDCENMGQVAISRMQPGDVIEPHSDMTMYTPQHPLPGLKFVHEQRVPVPAVYQRYQIPLYAKPGVVFICGDERLEMRPGTIWSFNQELTHSVQNCSDDVRISMIADIRSFQPIG